MTVQEWRENIIERLTRIEEQVSIKVENNNNRLNRLERLYFIAFFGTVIGIALTKVLGG